MNNNSIISRIEEVINGWKYFSVRAIKQSLGTMSSAVKPTTVNQYLSNMKKEGKIYSAGRGWYSSIPIPFQLPTKPIEKTVSLISRKFPLLPFTAWSTEQLQSHTHHMISRFGQFVFTDNDAINTLSFALKDSGYTAYANPRMRDVEKYFDLSQPDVVVVRSAITREPHQGHYASIEKILVDLLLEKDRLSLMDAGEYQRILNNVVASARINISRMIQYAERRKVDVRLVDILTHHLAEDIFLSGSAR